MLDTAQDSTSHQITAAASFINLLEVFADDFIVMTSNSLQDHLLLFMRTILIGIHSMLPPPEMSGHQGQEPISEKNLDQGEGTRETKKYILDWIVDRENFTLQLMQEKCEKNRLLKKVAKMKQYPLQHFQEVSGKLQHASFGTTSGKCLLHPIHMSMRTTKTFTPITPNRITALLD